MMNGVLMSSGIDGISVPAARAQEFNEKMARFYLSGDATEMVDFLAACHPDIGKAPARLPSDPCQRQSRSCRTDRPCRFARSRLFVPE